MKKWSVDDIKQAILNAYKDDFYSGRKNDRGWSASLEWILHNDEHVERMINLVPNAGKKQFESENLDKYKGL